MKWPPYIKMWSILKKLNLIAAHLDIKVCEFKDHVTLLNEILRSLKTCLAPYHQRKFQNIKFSMLYKSTKSASFLHIVLNMENLFLVFSLVQNHFAIIDRNDLFSFLFCVYFKINI